MSFVEERKVLTREKRLSTISHYNGTLKQLKSDVKGEEIPQRIRTFSQVAEDEVISAIGLLGKIGQSAIVVHGAIGCSASGVYFNQDTPIQWYSTNLHERDTILGGDGLLRNAIYRACRELNPKTVFIVGTPVVAINNDDVNSVILELEDELNIKIISVYTDGFKTKTPASGYDIVLHALLKYIVAEGPHESGVHEDFINVVTVSENTENLLSIVNILSDLGINFRLLPQFSDIDGIGAARRAKATIVLNEDEGALFAEGLEDLFNVPYIRTNAPIGIKGTRDFIFTIAKVLNIEERAKVYTERKEKEIQALIRSEILKDKKIFLDANLYNLSEFSDLISGFGGKIVAAGIPYVDLQNRRYLESLENIDDETPVVVGIGQLFEKANILNKTPADYYISLNYNAVFAAQYGCKPISLLKKGYYGYDGVKNFINLIKEADRQEVLQKKAANKDRFYKPTWLKRSSNWYVKQEVK